MNTQKMRPKIEFATQKPPFDLEMAILYGINEKTFKFIDIQDDKPKIKVISKIQNKKQGQLF